MMVKPMVALGSIELVGAEDILSHGIVKNILESPQGFGGSKMVIKSHQATEQEFFSQVVDPMDKNSVRYHVREVILFYWEYMTNQDSSRMLEKDYQELLDFVTFGPYGLCGNI